MFVGVCFILIGNVFYQWCETFQNVVILEQQLMCVVTLLEMSVLIWSSDAENICFGSIAVPLQSYDLPVHHSVIVISLHSLSLDG